MTLVRINGVRHSFGPVHALDGVSFDVAAGVTGILGPNGAGKTTLLRCLATVLLPGSGSIEMFGRDPADPSARREIRRRIGYMPQETGFYRSFTCFEFLDYLAILKEHTDTTARHDEARRVLGITGLDDHSVTKIRKLSGGMKRRLLLAQALIGSPELLILDEPTVGLDPEQRFRFREMISAIGESSAVLLSTHQTEDVAAICDRVVVLQHGADVFEGPPAELIALATERVWLASERPSSATISWRTGSGKFRAVGDPPSGAQVLEPTIEDGYLLLVGDQAVQDVSA